MPASPLPGLRRARAWFRSGGIPTSSKLLVLFALAYVVSPIDLIPDVPFIGWLDDAGVLAFASHHLLGRLREQPPAEPDPLEPR